VRSLILCTQTVKSPPAHPASTKVEPVDGQPQLLVWWGAPSRSATDSSAFRPPELRPSSPCLASGSAPMADLLAGQTGLWHGGRRALVRPVSDCARGDFSEPVSCLGTLAATSAGLVRGDDSAPLCRRPPARRPLGPNHRHLSFGTLVDLPRLRAPPASSAAFLTA